MAEQVNDDKKYTHFKLPTTVLPSRYELSLKPDLNQFTFEGQVKIKLDFSPGVTSVKEVTLNAEELVIKSGYVQGLDPTSPKSDLKKVTYSPSSTTATLEFETPVELSRPVISLSFTGVLNNQMKGFYRSAIKLADQTVYIATTQFESTDARRSLPCWDEPSVKSYFSVTLSFPSSVNAGGKTFPMVGLSNTDEKSRKTTSEGLTEVTFEDTPKMSTYLLAYVIGPFEKLSGHDGKRPVNVYTTPGKTNQAQFALDVACKSLRFYEDYFDIPYPLPKMDMIAIPDFTNGAMENWGLVTYRETCILVDPENTSTLRKQWVGLVVTHELAHQWFGNLVTMEWWTHLWLNEGFASFMEYLCLDKIYPEYDIWSQFITDARGGALHLDSLHNSHPIEVPVNHPSEIEEIFDDISYLKGASVIRMLYNYIGDECFRKGMKDYLEKFAYKNAKTEDLWDCLEQASNKPVTKIMSSWTSKKGYPWLSIEHVHEGNSIVLSITQNTFSADGKLDKEEAESTWLVPMDVILGSDLKKVLKLDLLDCRTKKYTIEGVGDNWIKLNSNSIGLYRVLYPEALFEKLAAPIQNQLVPAMDRLGVQDDIFALAQAGKTNIIDYLQLLRAFKKEDSYVIWSSIASSLGEVSTILYYTDFHGQFKAYGREIFGDIFQRLGWKPKPDEKHLDTVARSLVVERMVAYDDQQVIEEAKQLFKQYQGDSEQLLPDLRGAVYRAIVVQGDDDSFEKLFKIYQETDLAEEKNRVLRAMSFARDETRLNRAIDLCMSDQVRNQDKPLFLTCLGASNPPRCWALFKEHHVLFKEYYGQGHLMARVVKAATGGFATTDYIEEITKFFEAHKFPGTERALTQSLERCKLNSKLLERDRDALKAFFSAF